MKKLRVAMIVSDEREVYRRYADPDPSFGAAPDAVLAGLARREDCEVHTICCVQKEVRSPEKILGTIRHHTLVVPKLGWLRGGYLGCFLAIRRRLRLIQPDVVHGQGTERYCALAAVWSGYPNLITIHGNMRRIAKLSGARAFSFAWITARLESVALPRTDGVICISRHAERQVAPPAKRTWLVPNALRPSFFTGGNSPETPPVLLCLGTVSPVKNQLGLIRALDPLAGSLSFKVRFLGRLGEGDPYGDEFRAQLATRSWCEYLGCLDFPEVQRHLRAATALVLPSIEENLPLVILEAMAMGVPVAAAAVGGVGDLVVDGETGLLFDPNDFGAMRSKVGQILEQPDWARARAARAQAQSGRYRPEVVAASHVEIYRQLKGRN